MCAPDWWQNSPLAGRVHLKTSLRSVFESFTPARSIPSPLSLSLATRLLMPPRHHQLEVTELSSDDARNETTAAEDEGSSAASRSRPPRPGDSNPSVPARSRGTAGVKEGAATDQEEGGGGQRERGRPTSAHSAKSSSSKVEEELSVLRIGGMAGADGVSSGGDGPAGGLDSGEHRGRQDSSRSPLPHENGAGGEDDASVLDTPLQDKVREGRVCKGGSTSYLARCGAGGPR